MENIHQSETNEQQDLLSEVSDIYPQHQYATQWQRFANWLIDNLLMRYGLSYVTGLGVGALIAVIAPEFIENIVSSDGGMSGSLILLSLIVGYLNYIFYYTLCEKLFKGYTLGKIITGTRAVKQDGTELSFKDALLRSLCRCVPFEVFSGFSELTWHDSWTNTMVIKAR